MDKNTPRVISGYAISSGFVIKGFGIEASSKDFNPFSLPQKASASIRIVRFLTSLILLAGYIWTAFSIVPMPQNLMGLIRWLVGSAVFFVYIWPRVSRIIRVITDKTQKQWHDCEHKATNLLNASTNITLDNLKKTSPLSVMCGTQRMFAKLTACSVVYWLLILTQLNLFLCGAIILAIRLVLYGLTRCNVIFPIQYLTLKRPTENQLRETLMVAEDFIKKHEDSPWAKSVIIFQINNKEKKWNL